MHFRYIIKIYNRTVIANQCAHWCGNPLRIPRRQSYAVVGTGVPAGPHKPGYEFAPRRCGNGGIFRTDRRGRRSLQRITESLRFHIGAIEIKIDSVRTIHDCPYIIISVLRMEFGGRILCAPTPLYATLLKTVGDCHNQSADWFRNDTVFCYRVHIPPTYSLFPITCYFRFAYSHVASLLGMTVLL